MIKKTRDKIGQLQQQPEEERARAASRLIIIVSIIVIAIWLLILLPIQLFLGGSRGQDQSQDIVVTPIPSEPTEPDLTIPAAELQP